MHEKIEDRLRALEAKQEKPKDTWEKLASVGGALTVVATLLVALLTYRQSIQVQKMQATSAETITNAQLTSALDQQSRKISAELILQERNSHSSLTLAELDSTVRKQLAGLEDSRTRDLDSRDNEFKRYINNQNANVSRQNEQSEVDVKLVQLSMDILKSDSTLSNVPLRKWAIAILSKHSGTPFTESASDEAVAAPIVGEPITVNVRALQSSALTAGPVAIGGAEIWYSRPNTKAKYRFPSLTPPPQTAPPYTTALLSQGAYNFWIIFHGEASKPQQFYVDKNLTRIDLTMN